MYAAAGCSRIGRVDPPVCGRRHRASVFLLRCLGAEDSLVAALRCRHVLIRQPRQDRQGKQPRDDHRLLQRLLDDQDMPFNEPAPDGYDQATWGFRHGIATLDLSLANQLLTDDRADGVDPRLSETLVRSSKDGSMQPSRCTYRPVRSGNALLIVFCTAIRSRNRAARAAFRARTRGSQR